MHNITSNMDAYLFKKNYEENKRIKVANRPELADALYRQDDEHDHLKGHNHD